MSKKVDGVVWTPINELNPGLNEKYQAFKQAEQVAKEYKAAFEDDFRTQFQAKNGKLARNQQMVFSYRFGGLAIAVKTVEPATPKSKPKGISL